MALSVIALRVGERDRGGYRSSHKDHPFHLCAMTAVSKT